MIAEIFGRYLHLIILENDMSDTDLGDGIVSFANDFL